jgi:peptide-methionine (R)-S-oxide reductase
MADRIEKTEQEWREQLDEQAFEVCRRKGTERAFTGRYWDCKEDGIYRCVCCGNELFDSKTKFESGTGWPSFTEPLAAGRIKTEVDDSHGMRRIEVMCGRCDAHLGHVFPDGPAPSGERYCMNSVALDLAKRTPGSTPG